MPNSALAGWGAFIGEWTTTGEHPLMPGVVLHGRTHFEWLEGGAFVIMRTEIDEPGIPSGLAIFGSDDARGEQYMLYFDERGVSRRYDVVLHEHGFEWWRNAPDLSQRFRATLSEDGRTIAVRGELSKDGITWEGDLALTYSRV